MRGMPRSLIVGLLIPGAALAFGCGDDGGDDGGSGPGSFPDLRATYSATYEYRVDRDDAVFLEGTCSGEISIVRQDAESFSGPYSREGECGLDPYSSELSGTVDGTGHITIPFVFGPFFNVESLEDSCTRLSGSLSLRGEMTDGGFVVETTVNYTCSGTVSGEYSFHLTVIATRE